MGVEAARGLRSQGPLGPVNGGTNPMVRSVASGRPPSVYLPCESVIAPPTGPFGSDAANPTMHASGSGMPPVVNTVPVIAPPDAADSQPAPGLR